MSTNWSTMEVESRQTVCKLMSKNQTVPAQTSVAFCFRFYKRKQGCVRWRREVVLSNEAVLWVEEKSVKSVTLQSPAILKTSA